MTQEAGKHTPTPWEFDTYNHITAKGGHHKFAPDIIRVCSIADHPDDDSSGYTPEQSSERSWWYAESAANAAYIVQCVNAHEKLVEALQRLTGLIRDCSNVYQQEFAQYLMRQESFKLAEAALKLAGEEL